jgi:predicted nuclease with RNAse H fold
MVTATLRAPHALPAGVIGAPASVPARKGAFARFVDRLIEARLRKAEAEIRRYHRHLLPDELDRGLGDLPFVR